MTMPDYPLTAAMLAAILDVTRIDSDKMRCALHDVMVMKMSPSAAAARHGLHRQHLHVQLKHIKEDIKPAFDRYAALAGAQLGSQLIQASLGERADPGDR